MIELIKQGYLKAPGTGELWGICFGGCGCYNVHTWGYQHLTPRSYHSQHATLRFGTGDRLVAQVDLHFDYRSGAFKATIEADGPEVWITVATTRLREDDIVRIAWAQDPPAHAWASLEILCPRGREIAFDTRLPYDLVTTMYSREQQNVLRAMSGIAPLPERSPESPRHDPWGIEATATPEPWTVTVGEVFTEGWGMW